jgi:phosphate/sulfate permease
MNAYEKKVPDEMSPAQDVILALLSVLLMVIAIMVGYEFVQNPHSPSHTPVLMIFGALCATVNWIYLFIVQKKKMAWIPSAAIGLLLWTMTYVAIFTQ